MSTSLLKTLAFCAMAAASVGFVSAASATTLGGASGAAIDAVSQTDALITPVAHHGGYHGYHGGYHGYHGGNRWYGGYRGYRGYRGYHGYRGYRGYGGYYGYPGPYWGFGGYWGPNIYVAPYYYGYGYTAPPAYSAPPPSGSCAYWSRRCAKNWGYGNSNYRGCMRYQGCAPR